jgi:hypothetical protein
MTNWIKCIEHLPDEHVVVNTKLDDERGCRQEQRLIRQGRLWFFSDWSMYVYYVPTHWAPIEEEPTK